MQPLGFTRPDDLYSEANDISRDGNVIVGASRSPDGVDNAFAWTPTAGMRILPALPGSPLGIADAHGTNFDGSIIVGDSEDQTARRTATMWVNNTAMSLGVPEGWYRSRALEVNEAGDVVLGTLNSQAVVSTPAVWSSGSGWQLPGDYFAAQGFPLPTGWNVTSLNDISADGRTFAGSYNLGSGLSEAFVLTIPAPGAAMLLGAMSIPLLQRRRRPEETLSGGPTEAIPKNIPASAAKRNSLPLKPLQWRAQRHLIE
jgi:probable HAF family extracellular repeat protein